MSEILADEIIYANKRFEISAQIKEPLIDEPVSKAIGKKVYQQDPRLIKLIVGWKRNKPLDSLMPDNFLSDPAKIEELRKIFA